jgi:hypothetical protein
MYAFPELPQEMIDLIISKSKLFGRGDAPFFLVSKHCNDAVSYYRKQAFFKLNNQEILTCALADADFAMLLLKNPIKAKLVLGEYNPSLLMRLEENDAIHRVELSETTRRYLNGH